MDLESKKKTSEGSLSRLQPGTSRHRGSQKLGALLQRRDSDSDDERRSADQFPRAAAPWIASPSSSLVGVQIKDDEEALFFSRRSAMAAMITENPKSASLLPPRGSGRSQSDQSGHTMLQINAGGASSRLPSGLLYPCNSETGNPNSCLLNAAHFTFDSAILAPDQSNNNNLTERIFKKLMGQSKQQRDESKSPNSTLDCPASPASSERSLRGKSKKKSLRCRSEDANNSVANPRPKSQLAQYLRSMTAMSGDHDDDHDEHLEGPSEAAWLDPDSPYHQPCKKLESWSSNSNSWNLSLNPLKTIVSRRGGTPGRSGSRFRKEIAQSSLTGSYDGSRALRKGAGSEVSSGRSWWPEIGSGRKSTSIWACSGRSQAEAEADVHELEMKHRVVTREVERLKVDEAAFPFNNPVSSSFVFREGEKLSQRSSPADRITLHKTTVSGTDSDDLPYSDTYHDPEDGSITDSDTLSWDRELANGPAHDSGRSFDYAQGVVGLSSRGMSSRVLSGFFEMGRSGRFSVDLNRGQKLDKAQHLPTPDVRLRIFASEKSSKRSILSPCLPFLQKSPHKNVPRIQQAPSAASSRRIQAVNSFTARLGPVAENPTLAGQFHVQ